MLRGLARAVLDGKLRLDEPAEDVMADLALLPGFGPSRAQWVALRGYGEPDAFPADDPDLRRAFRTMSADGVAPRARAEAWRPWRGYAFFHLSREAAEPAPADVPRAEGPRLESGRAYGPEAVEEPGERLRRALLERRRAEGRRVRRVAGEPTSGARQSAVDLGIDAFVTSFNRR